MLWGRALKGVRLEGRPKGTGYGAVGQWYGAVVRYKGAMVQYKGTAVRYKGTVVRYSRTSAPHQKNTTKTQPVFERLIKNREVCRKLVVFLLCFFGAVQRCDCTVPLYPCTVPLYLCTVPSYLCTVPLHRTTVPPHPTLYLLAVPTNVPLRNLHPRDHGSHGS